MEFQRDVHPTRGPFCYLIDHEYIYAHYFLIALYSCLFIGNIVYVIVNRRMIIHLYRKLIHIFIFFGTATRIAFFVLQVLYRTYCLTEYRLEVLFSWIPNIFYFSVVFQVLILMREYSKNPRQLLLNKDELSTNYRKKPLFKIFVFSYFIAFIMIIMNFTVLGKRINEEENRKFFIALYSYLCVVFVGISFTTLYFGIKISNILKGYYENFKIRPYLMMRRKFLFVSIYIFTFFIIRACVVFVLYIAFEGEEKRYTDLAYYTLLEFQLIILLMYILKKKPINNDQFLLSETDDDRIKVLLRALSNNLILHKPFLSLASFV
eukprot:TRINITY_DN605_c0_g1_i3.p1 TRINITY_DN605_c0_g1~~TRINITY_DN605_c0_g1_i3.p1  ORF type:complete len:320 (-),score=16.71 TRINITY_DN605_c0_g1_i3:45-1004(-)